MTQTSCCGVFFPLKYSPRVSASNSINYDRELYDTGILLSLLTKTAWGQWEPVRRLRHSSTLSGTVVYLYHNKDLIQLPSFVPLTVSLSSDVGAETASCSAKPCLAFCRGWSRATSRGGCTWKYTKVLNLRFQPETPTCGRESCTFNFQLHFKPLEKCNC